MARPGFSGRGRHQLDTLGVLSGLKGLSEGMLAGKKFNQDQETLDMTRQKTLADTARADATLDLSRQKTDAEIIESHATSDLKKRQMDQADATTKFFNKLLGRPNPVPGSPTVPASPASETMNPLDPMTMPQGVSVSVGSKGTTARFQRPENAQGTVKKQLPPAQVLGLNEGKNVARMLPDVRNALKANKGAYGPITGRIQGNNPYAVNAQTFDAQMRTVSQAFGKFMEGGVLRKEDEEKYRKMFPQIHDEDTLKENKIKIVERMLAQRFESDRTTLDSSGYDVSGFEALDVPESQFGAGAIEASDGNVTIISEDGGKTWKDKATGQSYKWKN